MVTLSVALQLSRLIEEVTQGCVCGGGGGLQLLSHLSLNSNYLQEMWSGSRGDQGLGVGKLPV